MTKPSPIFKKSYRGRFAPSPTGPLHFGSMIAAIASYLEAKTNKGKWLVRIEDLDPPREIPGAATDILNTLEGFGLEWDEQVIYQSQRQTYYRQALEQLADKQHIYACSCTRKEITKTGRQGDFGFIYSGQCRKEILTDHQARALRVRTHNDLIQFSDRIQGRCAQRLKSELGDFVIRRADGLFAYQLAVVVDDAEQRITDIVRGSDLLDNTPRQIHLQQLLGYSTPNYAHLPIALAKDGQKLSKQTGAIAISTRRPQIVAHEILSLLNQNPPTELRDVSMNEIWAWAQQHWSLAKVRANNITVTEASIYQ